MRYIDKIRRFLKRNMAPLAVWSLLFIGWFGGAGLIVKMIWQKAVASNQAKIAAEIAGYIAGDDLIRAIAVIGVLSTLVIGGFAYFVDAVRKHEKG